MVAQLAGALHFLQIPAMFVAPRMLNWKEDFGKLVPINRWIFRVTAGGIVLTSVCLGAIVLLHPQELIYSKLGLSLSGFLALFWAYRASAQIFIYSRVWPRNNLMDRLSYYGMSILFPIKSALYLVCLIGGISKQAA